MHVFLFPLTGVTLPPGAVKPLNIFEARYRKMLDDSLAKQIPIALVYGIPRDQQFHDSLNNLDIPHENIRQVRTIAGCGMPQVFQKKEDGTSLITLEGQRKIRLKYLVPCDSLYLQAEAEILEDDFTLHPEDIFLFKSIERDFKKWIQVNHSHLEKHPLYRKMFRGPMEMLALFSELMVRDGMTKQLTLEAKDLHEKLFILSNYRLNQRKINDDDQEEHKLSFS